MQGEVVQGGEGYHLGEVEVEVQEEVATLVLYCTEPSVSLTRLNSWSAAAPASSKLMFSRFLNRRTWQVKMQVKVERRCR